MASKPSPSLAEMPLAKPVDEIPDGTLAALREAAAECRRCPLWRPATQTVFGQGPARARMMLVGEQPGAQEDLAGEPFVGPAGALLREVLGAAGLPPATLYLTNTVKHFKFEPRGKRRLHVRANASEQAACRPWLAAELLRVRSRVVVALGAMAAQTLFGNQFRLTRDRGELRQLDARTQSLATWHPSAILRKRGTDRDAAREDLLRDLKIAAQALKS